MVMLEDPAMSDSPSSHWWKEGYCSESHHTSLITYQSPLLTGSTKERCLHPHASLLVQNLWDATLHSSPSNTASGVDSKEFHVGCIWPRHSPSPPLSHPDSLRQTLLLLWYQLYVVLGCFITVSDHLYHNMWDLAWSHMSEILCFFHFLLTATTVDLFSSSCLRLVDWLIPILFTISGVLGQLLGLGHSGQMSFIQMTSFKQVPIIQETSARQKNFLTTEQQVCEVRIPANLLVWNTYFLSQGTNKKYWCFFIG